MDVIEIHVAAPMPASHFQLPEGFKFRDQANDMAAVRVAISSARVSSDGQAQPVSGLTCEAMTSRSVRADPWDLLEERTCATVEIDMDDSPLALV